MGIPSRGNFGKKWRKHGGGALIFEGEYDARSWTDEMDPKQVFPLTKKHTLNKYFLSVFAIRNK